jgi:restriction system protein
MGRRQIDLLGGLRCLFSVVHPIWSIPVAVVLFFIPVLSFCHATIADLRFIGYVFGAVLAIICLAASAPGWNQRWQRAAFLQHHIDTEWLNRLSWQDFERQVAEVYRQRGYQVEEVGGGGADGGVDLKLKRGSAAAIVQCKKWKTLKVGVRPVRELFGVLVAEKAHRAVLITSGVYSDEAIRFAEGKPIDLIDGAQLTQMLRQFQQVLKQSIEPSMASITTTLQPVLMDKIPARPNCPLCGNSMVLRRAKKGAHTGREFWGCSTFSKTMCHGKRNVE